MDTKKSGVKILCGVIACMLTVTQAVPSYAVSVTTRQAAFTQTAAEGPEHLLDLKIPASWGMVREVYNSGTDRVIVKIQDAHCDYQAQQNIAKILDRLAALHNVTLFALEGATGDVRNPALEDSPNKEAVRITADFFMREGRLTGAEYVALNSAYDLDLFGVEDQGLYEQNLSVFRQANSFREEAIQYFSLLHQHLDALKPLIYNEALNAFDRLRQDHAAQKMSFSRYALALHELAEKNGLKRSQYPLFAQLRHAIRLEDRIDFQQVDRERAQLITALTETLNDRSDLAALVDRSVNFRNGLLSSGGYANFLKELTYKARINLGPYPAFALYVDYITLYEQVASEKLFQELRRIEKDIADALYTDESQRSLDTLYAYLDTLEKLVDLKMMAEEAAFFQENRDAISMSEFTRFIQAESAARGLRTSLPADISYVDVYLPVWAKFYELVDQRDALLVDNTLRRMQTTEQKAAALVTGGFHTEKIARLLKERQVSYVVITPRASAEGDHAYLEIMQGNSSPLDDFIKQLSSTLQVPLESEGKQPAMEFVYRLVDTIIDAASAGTTKENVQQKVNSFLAGSGASTIVEEGNGGLKIDVSVSDSGENKIVLSFFYRPQQPLMVGSADEMGQLFSAFQETTPVTSGVAAAVAPGVAADAQIAWEGLAATVAPQAKARLNELVLTLTGANISGQAKREATIELRQEFGATEATAPLVDRVIAAANPVAARATELAAQELGGSDGITTQIKGAIIDAVESRLAGVEGNSAVVLGALVGLDAAATAGVIDRSINVAVEELNPEVRSAGARLADMVLGEAQVDGPARSRINDQAALVIAYARAGAEEQLPAAVDALRSLLPERAGEISLTAMREESPRLFAQVSISMLPGVAAAAERVLTHIGVSDPSQRQELQSTVKDAVVQLIATPGDRQSITGALKTAVEKVAGTERADKITTGLMRAAANQVLISQTKAPARMAEAIMSEWGLTGEQKKELGPVVQTFVAAFLSAATPRTREAAVTTLSEEVGKTAGSRIQARVNPRTIQSATNKMFLAQAGITAAAETIASEILTENVIIQAVPAAQVGQVSGEAKALMRGVIVSALHDIALPGADTEQIMSDLAVQLSGVVPAADTAVQQALAGAEELVAEVTSVLAQTVLSGADIGQIRQELSARVDGRFSAAVDSLETAATGMPAEAIAAKFDAAVSAAAHILVNGIAANKPEGREEKAALIATVKQAIVEALTQHAGEPVHAQTVASRLPATDSGVALTTPAGVSPEAAALTADLIPAATAQAAMVVFSQTGQSAAQIVIDNVEIPAENQTALLPQAMAVVAAGMNDSPENAQQAAQNFIADGIDARVLAMTAEARQSTEESGLGSSAMILAAAFPPAAMSDAVELVAAKLDLIPQLPQAQGVLRAAIVAVNSRKNMFNQPGATRKTDAVLEKAAARLSAMSGRQENPITGENLGQAIEESTLQVMVSKSSVATAPALSANARKSLGETVVAGLSGVSGPVWENIGQDVSESGGVVSFQANESGEISQALQDAGMSNPDKVTIRFYRSPLADAGQAVREEPQFTVFHGAAGQMLVKVSFLSLRTDDLEAVAQSAPGPLATSAGLPAEFSDATMLLSALAAIFEPTVVQDIATVQNEFAEKQTMVKTVALDARQFLEVVAVDAAGVPTVQVIGTLNMEAVQELRSAGFVFVLRGEISGTDAKGEKVVVSLPSALEQAGLDPDLFLILSDEGAAIGGDAVRELDATTPAYAVNVLESVHGKGNVLIHFVAPEQERPQLAALRQEDKNISFTTFRDLTQDERRQQQGHNVTGHLAEAVQNMLFGSNDDSLRNLTMDDRKAIAIAALGKVGVNIQGAQAEILLSGKIPALERKITYLGDKMRLLERVDTKA